MEPKDCAPKGQVSLRRSSRNLDAWEVQSAYAQEGWMRVAIYKGQKGLSLENSEKCLTRGCRSLLAPGSISSEKIIERESKMSRKPEKNI